jgi:hypothetical protein
MADTDPTGRGSIITLNLPPDHAEFLRVTIGAVCYGLLGDLDEHPERLRDPEGARLEADAHMRLLALVAGESVTVDDGMRAGLCRLARNIDTMNEYQRVNFEHAVLWGIIRRMEKVARRRR